MADTDDPTKGAETESKPKYVTVEKDEAPAPEPVVTSPPESPTSFSLLDADKVDEPATSEAQPVTKPAEQPIMQVSETSEVAETPTIETSTTDVKDWLGEEAKENNPQEEPKGKGKKIAIFIIILVVIAGIVAGGVYYYRTNLNSTDTLVAPSGPEIVDETTSPTPTPTEAPEEVDLSELSVSILNGSGIPGEAGKVETLLESAGFETIETGNADSYDFLDTGISVRSGLSTFVFTSIDEVLGGDYVVVESDELGEDSAFDVIVIVGSEKPSVAEATNTPTLDVEE